MRWSAGHGHDSLTRRLKAPLHGQTYLSQLGVPISKLAFMLASPTSAFTWLSAKRQQTQNFHSRRTIGTVVRSYYTLRHDEPVRSVRFLFIYFLFFYKFSHGIKFSTVKKLK